MTRPPADRDTDERDLVALAMRAGGADLAAIADRTGVSVVTVSKIVSRVRLADIGECAFWGDKPKQVASSWRPTIAQGWRYIEGGQRDVRDNPM